MDKRRLVFCLAGLLLVSAVGSLIAFSIYSSAALDKARGAQLQAEHALSEIDALRSALADLELGFHAYRATGDRHMLKLYSSSKLLVNNQVSVLRTLDAGSGAQAGNLNEIQRRVDSLVQELDGATGAGPGAGEAGTANSSEHLRALRHSLDQLQTQQMDIVKTRQSNVVAGSQQMAAIVSMLTTTIFIFAILLSLVLFFYFRAARIAEALAERNALLEQEVAHKIFQDAPIGLMRLTPDLQIKEVNKAFLNCLNLPPTSDRPMELSQILPRLAARLRWKVVDQGQTFADHETPIELPDLPEWRQKYWNIWAWPIAGEEDRVSEIVLVVMEVSDRVRLAHERDDLYATIAHDLRVPLLGANRILDLLVKQEVDDNARKEILAKLKESNARVLKDITQLIELSRYSDRQQQPRIEAVDLGELIRNNLSAFQYPATAAGIELKTNVNGKPFIARGNKDAMERVLVNLVDNALKFTREGGTVWVNASAADDTVSFEVVDTGCGIAPEVQKRLFQRFWRGAPGRYQASMGFGLYLCRKIVELYDGSLEFSSTPGKGTKFKVTFPAGACACNHDPSVVQLWPRRDPEPASHQSGTG
ncbi:MAG TPA: ATP-binding protein [Candidatus Obscuribacterales bacterium]